MKTAIFYSVNAGLYLWNDETGLLVDGIHSDDTLCFSAMPKEWRAQLHSRTGFFAHSDGLLFTHLHPDHFCEDELRAYLNTPRPPLVYGAELDMSTVPVRILPNGLRSTSAGPAEILSLRAEHDGARFKNVPNESFLIRIGGEGIFIAGDTLLGPEHAELLRAYCPAPDAAFFNLYQIRTPHGQEFIRRLAPARVFLYHFPFPEDDTCNVYPMARNAVRHYPGDLPAVELPKQMAWIDGRPAPWYIKQEGEKL